MFTMTIIKTQESLVKLTKKKNKANFMTTICLFYFLKKGNRRATCV